METIKINRKNTKVIAHRGLSGIEKENTAAAFVAAGNRDYFGIETDVHRTTDGKYIIIHDDNTGRVATEDLHVEETDYARLRTVQITDTDGSERGDLCLPSLAEYVKICNRYEKVGVLELKNDFDKKYVAEIIEIVKENYDIEHMVFISFSYQNMIYLRELLPEATLQYLYGDPVDETLIAKCLAYHLGLDIYYERLDAETIDLLHRNQIAVNCWTCNDAAETQVLIDAGVDFITTNILQ